MEDSNQGIYEEVVAEKWIYKYQINKNGYCIQAWDNSRGYGTILGKWK